MVPYALVGGAPSRTRQNAVDNHWIDSSAHHIDKRHREQRAHHCNRVTTTGDGTAGSAHREQQVTGTAGFKAAGRPCSAPEAQGYKDTPASPPTHMAGKIVISQHPRRASPLPIDAEIYKWRHLIENFFCKLKEFKRIAMRADKTDHSFAANILLAAAVINSR